MVPLMKKIVLVAINARYTHSCLALYCLKACVRGDGREVILREYSIRKDPAEIAREIAAECPDAVGLSVYVWNGETMKRIIPALKDRLPEVTLILGGPEAGYNPAQWLRDFPMVDYIVCGPGESGFAHVLDKRPVEKIVCVPNPPFGSLPFPYSEEDFPGLENRYVYFESSRGCPFRCAYCLSSRGDQGLESRPLGRVREELDSLLTHEPMLIKFVDRTFNALKEHRRGIWSHLIDAHGNGPTTFHFEIHPSLLEEDDFTLLSRCPPGLFRFEIGVQTVNPEARAAVGRFGEWTRERPLVERIMGGGAIHVHLDLIAGLPCDDMAWTARSFNETYSLRPAHLQLGFLKILPGTKMAEMAPEYRMEWDAHPPYRVRETEWLGRNELDLLDRVALLTDRLYNTGRFSTTLDAMEDLFDSPFELYLSLAGFIDKIGCAPDRSKESGARFLREFIVCRAGAARESLLDALGQDGSTIESPRNPGCRGGRTGEKSA